MRAPLVLSSVAVAALALTACSSANHKATHPAPPTGPAATKVAAPSVSHVVPIVAAENFWGDIASQIGGTHVLVTSIISDPSADPHTYETDPKDAAAIGAAKFVILNGLGYDDFASKLLAASPSASRTVIHVDQLNGVTGDNPNPHLWYNPQYVLKTAGAIDAALSNADPADAQSFDTNEATFREAYQAYVNELTSIKAKYSGTRISYTERVPGYLVDAAGLVLGTPSSFSQSVEDGNDPSPADTAVFDADITGKKVKVLLYNAQVADQQTTDIKALATKSGVPIVGVTETLPAKENFQTWQLNQATGIFRALGG